MSIAQRPLWTPEEFEVELAEMVAEEAPRLFAVVREHPGWVDAEISAWGMAFGDHADAISLGGTVYLGMPNAERALWFHRAGGRVTPRLMWVDELPRRLND